MMRKMRGVSGCITIMGMDRVTRAVTALEHCVEGAEAEQGRPWRALEVVVQGAEAEQGGPWRAVAASARARGIVEKQMGGLRAERLDATIYWYSALWVGGANIDQY